MVLEMSDSLRTKQCDKGIKNIWNIAPYSATSALMAPIVVHSALTVFRHVVRGFLNRHLEIDLPNCQSVWP